MGCQRLTLVPELLELDELPGVKEPELLELPKPLLPNDGELMDAVCDAAPIPSHPNANANANAEAEADGSLLFSLTAVNAALLLASSVFGGTQSFSSRRASLISHADRSFIILRRQS